MSVPESPHNISTLKDLMDERDRRYSERFAAQEEAVRLAKIAANAGKGTVNISVLIGVLALILTIIEKFK
jgi:hypothetical protein